MTPLDLINCISYPLALPFPYSVLGAIVLLGIIYLAEKFYKKNKNKIKLWVTSKDKTITALVKLFVLLSIFASVICYYNDNYVFPATPKDKLRVAISPFHLVNKESSDLDTPTHLKQEIQAASGERIEVVILKSPPILNDEDARFQGKKAGANFVIYGGDNGTVGETFNTEFHILPTNLTTFSQDQSLFDKNKKLFVSNESGELLLDSENGKMVLSPIPSPNYYANQSIRIKSINEDMYSTVCAICALEYYTRAEYDSAFNLFKIITHYESEPNILFYMGNCYLFQSKFNESLHYYDKATEIEHNFSEIWVNTGLALCCLNESNKSIIAYDRAIETSRNDSYAWNNKGNVLYNLNNYVEAIKAYDNATEVDPRNSFAWYNKGLALENLNKTDEAIKAYDNATEVDPRNSFAWYNKGLALDNLNKYGEAINAYDRAIEIDQNDSKVWNNKGLALEHINKSEEAIVAYDKAIGINPKDSYAWYNKGLALEHINKSEEAIVAYDKAIGINPKNSNAWIGKGLALYNLNKSKEAIKACDKAIEIDPDNSYGWYNLACMYILNNNKDQAIFNLKKAIDINSSLKEVAKKDDDFKELWTDKDFKKLTS